MHAPERLRIEIGLQLLDGPVVGFTFHARRHNGDQTVVDGRVHDILRIHDEVAIVALHQKLSALRAELSQRRITAAIDSAAGPKKPRSDRRNPDSSSQVDRRSPARLSFPIRSVGRQRWLSPSSA